jgi:hypothetical protein
MLVCVLAGDFEEVLGVCEEEDASVWVCDIFALSREIAWSSGEWMVEWLEYSPVNSKKLYFKSKCDGNLKS